jgi:hypothetical protein
MTLRLLPLAHFKRALLGAGALICYVAAIVLAPSDVRSQLDRGGPKQPAQLRAHIDLPPAPVAPQGDAFAPRAAIDDDPLPAPPVRALQPLPRLPVAPAALVRPLPPTRVTAIATGTQPTAIIDSGGTTRVVGIGDDLDGSTIERIDEAGVALANGRQLLLEPAPGQ